MCSLYLQLIWTKVIFSSSHKNIFPFLWQLLDNRSIQKMKQKLSHVVVMLGEEEWFSSSTPLITFLIFLALTRLMVMLVTFSEVYR